MMSDSEESDVAHKGHGMKDHPPHGNRLSNGEMCARCGEVHWHCGTLEEVAIETSLSCIRHLAPMRAFHMEVADLYLQLLKDGWMEEGDDGADWAELGTDLVIKWIANLVQDGTMDRFSSKAIMKVFGKDVSDFTRMAAKRAARVHLAAVTVVSDYLSELFPSLWRKKLNLKGLSLLKRRVAVAQAVHKHCQNVVWDGSRGTLIGTVGPLCRKVLNFDMDEVDRLMVKIKTELKQTRLLEDASGMGHPSERESVSPPKARVNGHRESVVDEKAEQASKAIADALMATEEANKRLTDAIASGDPDQMQAAVTSGDRADPSVRKAATKAMRKARVERQQAEAARQKELERKQKEAEEAERAEAAARALALTKLSKKKAPTPVSNKYAALEEKDDAAGLKKKKAAKSKPSDSKADTGAGALWKEARRSGLESVRSTPAAEGTRERSGNEDLTWDAMALKYNGFNSHHAAPSTEELLKRLQESESQGAALQSSSGEWGQSWQTNVPPLSEAQSATSLSSGRGAGESFWGTEPVSEPMKRTDSSQTGGVAPANGGLPHTQAAPVGNGVYKEFLTEAEQDFWKPVISPSAGVSSFPPSFSQSVADLQLKSKGSWGEPAGPHRPANGQYIEAPMSASTASRKTESRGGGGGRIPRDDEEECVICWDGPRNALYLPCGHARFCYPCAMQTFEAGQPCPVCRSSISWVQQIFD
ncbi:hypothetical protein KFL_004800080 [Klebsormidium nitens]|uniref:RING-type domain-containing protein n=1 Tax=Klebsormidium nitens TaxID=105231 RepID=A0A1Y1IEI8_KLENI|nr:hypothetical protein KFL_004800080 [Klebsormidium nitens]|eukprot:GAQ89023.1 hypothetical protein KFL_004800080 [Klebsormidium nitens]